MDFSWCNINSINSVFNGLSIIQYLNLTYDFLYEHKNDPQNILNIVKSMVYICSTHFLKIIIKRLNNEKEKFQKSSMFQSKVKTCIFFFTLLQNSTTIEQFNIFLEHLYNIFMSKTKSLKTLNSLQILLNAVADRSYNEEINDYIDFERDISFEQKLLNQKQYVISEAPFENIKTDSPFTKYYKIFEKKLEILNDHLNDDNFEENEYFYPKFYKILTGYLHILPLWSGILLNKFSRYYNITQCNGDFIKRLSNNPVENLFGLEKHSILYNQKQVMPSEFVGPEARWLISIFYEHYNNDELEHESYNKKKKIQTEKWVDKKLRSKRKKGYFFV